MAVEGGRNVLDGELSNNQIAVTTPGGRRTASIVGGIHDTLDGELGVAQVVDKELLLDTVGVVAGDDGIKSDSVGSDIEKRRSTLARTCEAGMAVDAVAANRVGSVDNNISGQEADLAGREGGRNLKGSALGNVERHGSRGCKSKVGGIAELDARHGKVDNGSASNLLTGAVGLDVGAAKVGRGSAVERRIDGRAVGVNVALVGSDVDEAISENGASKLVDARNAERVDHVHSAALGNSIVDSQAETLDISDPEETGTRLAVERRRGTMADTENVGIGLGSRSDLGEGQNAIDARVLEDVGGVLDDVDVDVASLKRVHTGAGVNRVVVLEDLNDGVAVVSAVAIATKIVHVEPVCLATLASDDTNALDVTAGKLWRQQLERRAAKVLVGAVKSLFLPGHEEVDNLQATVSLKSHVNSRLFLRSRRLISLDGDGGELRSISVTGSEEDGASIVRGKTAAGHPNTTALGSDGNIGAFGSPALDNLTGGLVPADDPTAKVVLDAVGCEASIYVVANVEQAGSLVVDAGGKDAIEVVGGLDVLQVDGEVGSLGQVVDINGVDVVAAGRFALGLVEDCLVEVGLGCEVEGIGAGVNNTRGGDANVGVDVDAAVKVGSEKGNMKIALCDNLTSLGVHLV